jgi:hypothetical protein
MKVAIIPPLANTELAEGDYHLILPQHITPRKRSAYKLFYQATSGYKILDNGAAEGKLIKNADLMAIARTLAVDEIVVPDVLGDAAASYQLAQEFEPFALDHDWFKYMGVVQGRDRAEVAQSVFMLMDLEYISVLAIPRHLCQKVSRYERFDIVYAMGTDIAERFEAVHFLGSSGWPKEVVLLADLPLARGIDTSYPTYMAQMGFSIDEPWQPRPRKYFTQETFTEEGEALARDNIEQYRMWAS